MKPSETIREFQDWPASDEFGHLLDWHLARGTRPAAVARERGMPWTQIEFAAAISISSQMVGRYIKKGKRPTDVKPILEALFKDNPAYDEWKKNLEMAWSRLRDRASATDFFIGVPSRLPSFVGRDATIQKLRAALHPKLSGSNGYEALIIGMPGVGKTSLASEYAHVYSEAYQGVWWFSAESREKIIASLLTLASYLGFSDGHGSDAELSARLCVRELAKETAPLLLIYDNVEDPCHVEGLIATGEVRTLITTRYVHWDNRRCAMQIDTLPPLECVRLMHSITGYEDEQNALNLSTILGHLPLALNHAATTCRLTRQSFLEYASKAERLLSISHRSVSYPRSVYATFVLAIDDATDRAKFAGKLMSFLSQCSPDLMPFGLFENVEHGGADLSAALLILIESSLVQSDKYVDGTPAIRVHRVVQSVARARLAEIGSSREIQQAVAWALGRNFPSYELLQNSKTWKDTWAICERYLPHVVALETRIDKSDLIADVDMLFYSASVYAALHGNITQATILARSALQIAENQGKTVEAFGFTYKLGSILSEGHRSNEALEVFMKLRDIAYAQEPKDNDALISIHQQISKIFLRSGRHKEAELELAKGAQLTGPASKSDDIASQTELAHIRADQGNLSEALAIYTDVRVRIAATLGPNHWKLAEALHNLATCHCLAGDEKSALPLLHEAFLIEEKCFGLDHHVTCKTLTKLGYAVAETRADIDWTKCFTQAIKGLEKLENGMHPGLAECYVQFGIVLRKKKRFTEAICNFAKAYDIIIPRFGDDDKLSLTIITELAESYFQTGQDVEACGLLDRAVVGYRAVYGRCHEKAVYATFRYASVLREIGRPDSAHRLLSDLATDWESGLSLDETLYCEIISFRDASPQ